MGFGIPVDVYLSSDEAWLAGFFAKTHLSSSEISELIRQMPQVFKSQLPCRNKSAWLAMKVYAGLNVDYLHSMLSGRGDLAMSVWSLKAFHDRDYLRFMNGVACALQESFLTGKPIEPLGRNVAEKLTLHNTCQLTFPLESTRGLEFPRARDIHKAFADVKTAIQFGLAVDSVSKKLVEQAVAFDVKSLEFMNQIAGIGVLRVFSNRLFGLYKDTLAVMQALPKRAS